MGDADNRQLEHHEVGRQRPTYPLSILANDLELPGNVGSLFRLADALGVEKLYLTGSTPVPPNRKLSKSARNAERHVAWMHADDGVALLKALKQDGLRIVALEITSHSLALERAGAGDVPGVCLLVGTEGKGIAPELLALADLTVHIPMHGHNSSMNVAMACAIAVYEITRAMGRRG